MEATIAAALVAACASVCSALIAVIGQRRAGEAEAQRKAYEAERMEQEQARQAVDAATAQGMLAVLEAVDVSLVALQGGHLDGNVDEARAGIRRARETYQQTRSETIARLI